MGYALESVGVPRRVQSPMVIIWYDFDTREDEPKGYYTLDRAALELQRQPDQIAQDLFCNGEIHANGYVAEYARF